MIDRRNLVSFVERALLLKTLPVLSDASPDQIAAIVDHLRERSFMPGAPLFRAAEAPREIHLVVEGRVRAEPPDGRRFGPAQFVGMLAALEQHPHTVGCVSETAVQTLALGVDDLFDLLEDFFDLTRALLGYLARHVAGRLDGDAPDGGAPFGGGAPAELIDKSVFMKSVPLLAGASIDELARLGREVTEENYAAGARVFAAGQRAEAFFLVLRGRPGAFGPRTSVGALDVLGQAAHAETVVATQPSRVLRVPGERFFDLLEDHFDLTARIARQLSAAARLRTSSLR